MLIPINEFFRTLPQKCCAKCGEVVEEQADCYTTICENCHDFVTYPIGQK
ncbi:protein YhfH [Ammoniphilus resinae]|uniref:YhfH family protein n=1 Tax=Ammoniphilus resinae TaxID=861532 RepID=A0ABS4GTJ5_9BACL|nr:protein YhfH [Ammoniphilus resinae]MBP1933602.1 hypothetical protein [Ammoniphilus resinae]